MKTQKIFLVIAALILVLALLAGCGPVPEEQERSTAPDCFVIEDDAVYTDITTLEGKVVASNDQNNLVALLTETASTYSGTSKTIKFYDLATKTVIFSHSGYLDNEDVRSFEVSLENYPLAQVTLYRDGVNDDGDEAIIGESTYYLITGRESSCYNTLVSSTKDTDVECGIAGNMYVYGIDDNVYFVNKAGVVVRTEKAPISDSYTNVANLADYFDIDAEYKGYLYSWELSEYKRMIQIYDSNGNCAVQYNFSDDAVVTASAEEWLMYYVAPKIHVLNDGNVFVQYCTIADDDATEWDFTYNTYNMNVVTEIINYTTGEVTSLDYNYIVLGLESAYDRINDGEYSDFAFELATGYDNQALVVKFANGYFSDKLEYKVVDNTMTEKYTLCNDDLAYIGTSECYEIENISEYSYNAYTVYNGDYVKAKYDYDGNLVAVLAYNADEEFGSYYCTPSGVYTFEGELKYDLIANGFVPYFEEFERAYIVMDDQLFLGKYNFITGTSELYVLNTDTWEAELVADGYDIQVASVKSGDGFFSAYNQETDVSILYNADKEIILKVRGQMNLHSCDDVIYVTVNVGGDDLVYVITQTVTK